MTTLDTDSNETQTKIDRKALTVAVSVPTLRRFRLACAAEGRSMSVAAEEALAAWLDGHFDAAMATAANK